MRTSVLSVVLPSVVLTIFLYRGLPAQTTTSGALIGTVTDPIAAVVPGALIELQDNSKGAIQRTRTDRGGGYQFFFLAPGSYTLTVSHAGFRTEKRAVDVLLGTSLTVNLTLEIEKASTTIAVAAEAPFVQAENGDLSATLTQKQISEVPNPGNDLTYIVQTAPGVVMNTDVQGGANFSILGMPAFSYLHTVDGMNDNDNAVNLSLVGPLFLLLGQNQIQEATVVSTGYSGQFGGAAGGNVNYITKSGSNRFHGNAQYYWNGRAFNANDWFNNAFGNPRPFSIANQWAGSFGGPIKKDKLFFFFDSEGLRLLIPQIFFVALPSVEFERATLANIDSKFGSTSASDAFYRKMFSLYDTTAGAASSISGGPINDDPRGCNGFQDVQSGLGINLPCSRHFFTNRGRPSQDALTSARFDWNINQNDRAFVRLQYDAGHGAVGTDPISPAFDAEGTQPWWQTQFLETHTFGSSTASQLLIAGSYFAPIFRVKNASRALAAFPTTLNFAQGTFNNLGGSDYYFADGFGRFNTQYQISEDVVKTLGSHKFGFGGSFAHTYWNALPGKSNTIGQLTVQSLDAFYQGGLDANSPTIDFTTLDQAFTTESYLPTTFLSYAIYGEDEWRFRPNLVLTAALRTESYSNPSCRSLCYAHLAAPFDTLRHDPSQPYDAAILLNQRQAFERTDKVLWSPRISFAWQPLGMSHNNVIRGGFGIFYDPLPGRMSSLFSANPPLFNSYTVVGDNLTPNETTSLFKIAATSNSEFLTGFNSGETLSQIQAGNPNFSPPAISVSEKRTHFPQYQRWSLEWEEAFGADTSMRVGYSGYHGIHGLILNPNANAFGFGSLPSGLCTSPPVPPCADPRFSKVTEINTNTVSNYHGMVASFRHRFSRWTQGLLQANYTFGHALDEVSSSGAFFFSQASLTSAQDPNNLRGSYGSADHDVRHSFNANYVWELPVKAALGGRGWDTLVSGWQVSGTIFARTGFPYTVFDFEQSGRLGANTYFGLLYAVPTSKITETSSCGKGAAIPSALHPCQTPQLLPDGNTPNPNARFLQSGCLSGFNVGNLPGASGPCSGATISLAQGRNQFRGPGYFNTDFTIMKNTKLRGWENGSLGIGFQFFNFFNHPNFGFPDPGLSSQVFGQILYLEQPPTSILGSGFGGDASPRMIQLKVQLQF